MTRDEHIAAAEKWLARAERLWNASEAGRRAPFEATAAAGIATAHFAAASVPPRTAAEEAAARLRVEREYAEHHKSSPAGQGHDGQETR